MDPQPARTAAEVAAVVDSLVTYQRHRRDYLKSRQMLDNRLESLVALALGYAPGMTKTERTRYFNEAKQVIKAYARGTRGHDMDEFLDVHLAGLKPLEGMVKRYARLMEDAVARLPVASWARAPAQKGLGLLNLAILIGEAGNLDGYANPGKLWKRLGCAPWTWRGTTRMGSTWKFQARDKLPAEQWSAFGYSPRRHAIAYVAADCLMKGNGDGPYRARYDETKADYARRYPDRKKQAADRHGKLLAVKLLLKNLWCVWRNADPGGAWQAKAG